MSIQTIYALRDTEAKQVYNPKALADDVTAKRHFRLMCKNELGEFKDSFEYVKIGVFNTDTGTIMPIEPEVLVTGGQIQIKKEGE